MHLATETVYFLFGFLVCRREPPSHPQVSPIGKLADYANCDDYCDDHCDDYCDDHCADPSGFPVWVWPLSLTVWLTVSQFASLSLTAGVGDCCRVLMIARLSSWQWCQPLRVSFYSLRFAMAIWVDRWEIDDGQCVGAIISCGFPLRFPHTHMQNTISSVSNILFLNHLQNSKSKPIFYQSKCFKLLKS